MSAPFLDESHQFEIHYILNREGDHSLNAFALNRAQYQFLLFAREVSALCGVPVQIEAQAITEGGIRETWKVFGKSAAQVGVVLTALGLLASAYPIYRDRGLADLQRQSLGLDIELKKQEIEKNRIQLEKLREDVRTATPDKVQQVVKQVKEQVETNHKAQILRSKYFEKVIGETKVKALEFSGFKNGHKVFDSQTIQREDFDRFILKSDELPIETHDSAQIEIIAPVLSKGRYNWKGRFCGETIDFRMSDDTFKKSVINKEVSFKNGMTIECVMEIKRKVDDDGEERISNYNVTIVTKILEGIAVIETPQGIEYKVKLKNDERQLPLSL